MKHGNWQPLFASLTASGGAAATASPPAPATPAAPAAPPPPKPREVTLAAGTEIQVQLISILTVTKK